MNSSTSMINFRGTSRISEQEYAPYSADDRDHGFTYPYDLQSKFV